MSGGTGSLNNQGTITGGYTFYDNPRTLGEYRRVFYSAYFGATTTATLINGSRTNAEAALTNGIQLSGAGRVTNYGSIGPDQYETSDHGEDRSVAVDFTQASDTLVEEGTGSITGEVIGGGGTLILGGDAGAGTMAGSGNIIAGGFANIQVAPNADWTITGTTAIATSTTFDDEGSTSFTGKVTNDGTIVDAKVIDLGSSGQIVNDADGTIDFEGTSSLTEASGATGFGLIDNGMITRSGAGTTAIGVITSIAESAKVDVESGTLKFGSRNTTIAGSVYGAGALVFGPGRATLASGASITTAGLQLSGTGAQVVLATTLSYSGTFGATAGSELTVDSGDTFTLAGPTTLSGLTIDGSGRVNLHSSSTLSAVTIGGQEVVTNAATATETGTTTVDSGARLVNASGATFDLDGNGGIAGGGSVTNAGLLVKTAGTARSVIAASFSNTSTVEAQTGTIAFSAAVGGNGGTLQVDSGATLEFDAAVTATQTVSFDGSGGDVLLKAASSFAAAIEGFASGDTIDLRSFRTSGETLSYAENAAGTGGVLTIKSGTNTASLTFDGQYTASGFQIAPDSAGGGTNLTYSAPAASASSAPAYDSLAHSLFDAALGGGTSGTSDAAHASTSAMPPILVAAPVHALSPSAVFAGTG